MATPASRWIDARISEGLDRAFERIDRYQREGYCTEDDVIDALALGWDDAVVEAWREYREEAE